MLYLFFFLGGGVLALRAHFWREVGKMRAEACRAGEGVKKGQKTACALFERPLNWWNKLIKFDGHFLHIWMDMKKGAKLVSLRASYASNVTLQNVVSSHLWCTGPLNSILLLACYVMTTMHNLQRKTTCAKNGQCLLLFLKSFYFYFLFKFMQESKVLKPMKSYEV